MLSPLSLIYGAITGARNSFYETGIFKSFSLGVPTISVGNITVGGTGKTPLVALAAEILADAGEKVGVLSRGYGRENPKRRILVSDGERILAAVKQSGDEPFELAQKLLGKAVIIADGNRVSAGNWAREKFGITAFVLDDAFQHRRVKRDIDIVTIDATNPFGSGKLLPSGILREPPENLKRADAVVITRANLSENVADLEIQILNHNQNCRIFVSRNRISNLIDLEEFSAQAQGKENCESRITNRAVKSIAERRTLTGNRFFAFCALGNPNNFFELLQKDNFSLILTEAFPDHYFYTQKDITKLETAAREAGAPTLLTTAKDAVKLKDLKFDLPCLVVESEMVFDDEDNFCDWLTLKLQTIGRVG